ncbi:hypothetical protein [Litchfieldia alkalitelluris]|uniref:hypothetical protein n=1 Tax=Litchfieldia alkalitelluris TaxID=304268 RepID=UPI000998E71A|nr:hypothetical protein [Litchfieldia alkalitelluris]
MNKKIFQLIIAFGSGYLMISSIQISVPFEFKEFIVQLVLSPSSFFLFMIYFLISFFLHAILIKDVIEKTNLLKYGRKVNTISLLLCYSVFISIVILCLISFWQTMILVIFSVIYGALSTDLKKQPMSVE